MLAAACNYQTSSNSSKISTSLLFHQKILYIKMFSKMELKCFSDLRNRVWSDFAQMGSDNLVPKSHSVTSNVRCGKVREYTIFHWLLKKGCGNAIYAPIGLFRGALSEGLVFASSCAEESFVFFQRRKSCTVEEYHFKNLRRSCKWYRRKPHVHCHSNKDLSSLLRGTQKLINSS